MIICKEYNPAKCMESYARRTAGCASPWEAFPEPEGTVDWLPPCSTWEEAQRLLNVHDQLIFEGASTFQQVS